MVYYKMVVFFYGFILYPPEKLDFTAFLPAKS